MSVCSVLMLNLQIVRPSVAFGRRLISSTYNNHSLFSISTPAIKDATLLAHDNFHFQPLKSSFSTYASPVRLMGLEEFRDTATFDERMQNLVGRSWSVKELRRKDFDDLHKLWLVLYKERNMLLTEIQLCRRKGIKMPQSERIRKVRKSMGAIKAVLGERKRDKIAQVVLLQMQDVEYNSMFEDDDIEEQSSSSIESKP